MQLENFEIAPLNNYSLKNLKTKPSPKHTHVQNEDIKRGKVFK